MAIRTTTASPIRTLTPILIQGLALILILTQVPIQDLIPVPVLTQTQAAGMMDLLRSVVR